MDRQTDDTTFVPGYLNYNGLRIISVMTHLGFLQKGKPNFFSLLLELV